MPQININELKEGRSKFIKEEWIDIMFRSIGMEADEFNKRENWLLLTRLIPLVENNFNLCELGPRSTGKSHIYKEVSPNVYSVKTRPRFRPFWATFSDVEAIY